MQRKPHAVTVIAAFLYFATFMALSVGAFRLFPNAFVDRLLDLNKPAQAAFRATGRLAGVPLILLCIATFRAAKGLLRGEAWAWWFAVALFTIDIIGDIVSFAVTGDWL